MGSLPPGPGPKPWVETPLVLSRPLSLAAGCNVYLKLDNLQPSGSFKSRGIGNLMSRAVAAFAPPVPPTTTSAPLTSPFPPNDGVHFFSSSGGNAGLACATSALALKRPATIVVPLTTPALMVSKLRALGAAVTQTGADWAAADAYLRTQLLARHVPPAAAIYVPPFDHPDIWAGASTLVDEVVAQMPAGTAVDAFVCSVGGGGLLNGIMAGVERHCGGLPGETGTVVAAPRVLAVETAGADSLHASVLAGRPVTLDGITSIATSLGAKRVADRTWEWAVRGVAAGALATTTVTDAEAAAACVRFLDDERMLVEVACGATIATAYNGGLRRYFGKGLSDAEWAVRNVVLVVCGGSNINLDMLMGYKATYGV